MNIEGSSVLITGGGSGIGLATAQRLVAAGAKVAICGRRPELLQAAAESCGALSVVCDVSDPEQVRAMVERVVAEHGGLHALINNAAFGYSAPLLELDVERFDAVFATNVRGALLVGQACARHMAANGGGTILNVGSTAASKGYPGGSAYAGSKFALTGLTECWRSELRKHDIRVMQVNPSEVITPFGGRQDLAEQASKLRAEDVAQVIESCLALDDRGFITQTTLWATNPQ
ncbi:MAG: 3-oxoacyl-[acyl-carrier protein] reductase [Planctomycetota bacterium]|jgi:3-oxoacyl-[acyl-carrier protein] reductase